MIPKMDGHGQDQTDHAHLLDRGTIPYSKEGKSHLRCNTCPLLFIGLLGVDLRVFVGSI